MPNPQPTWAEARIQPGVPSQHRKVHDRDTRYNVLSTPVARRVVPRYIVVVAE